MKDENRDFSGFCNGLDHMLLLEGGTAVRTEYTYIADDETKFGSYFACLQYEQGLEIRRKKEYAKKVKEASDRFLRSVGFNPDIYSSLWERNQAYNNTWLIFDRYGKVEGLKTCNNLNYPENGCDFCFVSGEDRKDRTILLNWLLEHRLYAHCLCSFVERNLEFYEWGMIRKLENLGWNVKAGVLY